MPVKDSKCRVCVRACVYGVYIGWFYKTDSRKSDTMPVISGIQLIVV